MFLIKLWLQWAVKWAAYRSVVGRYVDRTQPEKGRLTRAQIDRIIEQMWRNVAEMLPAAHLEQVGSLGNRQNVFLTVMSLAAYRAFLAAGIERDYATELFADLGWKIYETWLILPRFVARLVTRDAQKQMNLMLRLWLWYPFNPPGYQRTFWADRERFCIDWTRCPAYEYVKRHGKAGEGEFFRNTWCQYDWAVAQAMVKGGVYERTHTLADGDPVCDMRWYAKAVTARAEELI